MNTKLLYLEDDYIREFHATIKSIKDNQLVLDQTAFYPTGGHQECDTGRIVSESGEAKILKVEKKGQTVIHHIKIVKGKLIEGELIRGIIDWDRRYHLMCLHTAQHILSRVIFNKYKIGTDRSDFTDEGGLLVLKKPIGINEIINSENTSNELIDNDLDVVRIIRDTIVTINIGKFDSSRCGGTHVRKTSEIKTIKILDVEDRKIFFDVGKHAHRKSINLANYALTASNILNLRTNKLISGINDLNKSYRLLQEENVLTKKDLAETRISVALNSIEQINDVEILSIDLSFIKSKEMEGYIKEIEKDGRIIICMGANKSIVINSNVKDFNANDFIQRLCSSLKIKGGGSSSFAQAGPVDNIEGILKLISNEVKSL